MPLSRRRQDSDSSSESDTGASNHRKSTQQKKRGRPSQQSQRRRQRDDSDEESSEGGGQATQRKGKGTQKSMEKMPKTEQVTKSWDIARLALCAEFTRKPLTRNEINKEVLQNHTRQFKETMDMAQKHTLASLGMELVELRAKATGFGVEHNKKGGDKKKKKKKGRDSDESESEESEEEETTSKWSYVAGKQYILRSVFDRKTIARAANVDELWGEDEPTAAVINVKAGDQLSHIGILYIILSLILVSGRELPDDRLRSHLKKLDIMPDVDLPINNSTAPSTAGNKLNIDGLLRSFTVQGYLERISTGSQNERSRQLQREAEQIEAQTSQSAGGDPNTDWRWGARADAEIGETNIGHFIETFFGEPDAERERQKEISNALWKNMGKAAGEQLQVAQPIHAQERPRQEK